MHAESALAIMVAALGKVGKQSIWGRESQTGLRDEMPVQQPPPTANQCDVQSFFGFGIGGPLWGEIFSANMVNVCTDICAFTYCTGGCVARDASQWRTITGRPILVGAYATSLSWLRLEHVCSGMPLCATFLM
jgi:hypothetical protein